MSRPLLAFPLDVSSLQEVGDWCERLQGVVDVFKVGLELYTACGPAAVETVQKTGAACFLDLKLHDIPATVHGAVRSARSLDVAFLTIHALGGKRMIEAALEAQDGSALRLLGVTVLTSHGPGELPLAPSDVPLAEHTLALAREGYEAGLRGFVCSSLECKTMRTKFDTETMLVVPGIRPLGADLGDQKRVATPFEAVRDGANMLVVGRPIRQAKNPREVAEGIRADAVRALR